MTEGSFHRRRSSAVWLAGAALALAVGGGAWLWYNGTPPAPRHPPKPRRPHPPPPPVTVSHPLRRDPVESDEFTGQFGAVDYVEIRAHVPGYLQSIHFQDGQIVQKGALLFVIDPRPYEAALASAKAQLAQSNARLDLANQQLARAGALRQRDVLSASTYDERVQEVPTPLPASKSPKPPSRPPNWIWNSPASPHR